MKHFKNLGLSFLAAWGTAAAALMVVFFFAYVIESWPVYYSTFADMIVEMMSISLMLGIGTFIYVGLAYIFIAIPYYFVAMHWRPENPAWMHYSISSGIAFVIIMLIALVPDGHTDWQWVFIALIASLSALAGTHVLIRRTRNDASPAPSNIHPPVPS